MSLLVYNMTAQQQRLATLLGTKIPPSTAGAGKRGFPWRASGKEMRDRSPEEYEAVQAQVSAGIFQFEWEFGPEYPTPGLFIGVPPAENTDAAVAGAPVLSLTAVFGDPPDGELGQERSITLVEKAPYDLRILQVFGVVTRGVKGAQLYVCCDPLSSHEPYSDKFDVSQIGPLAETSHIGERVVEAGESVYAVCTTDQVRGALTFTYQKV